MEPNYTQLLDRLERLERVVEGLLDRDPKAAAALGLRGRIAPTEAQPVAATPRQAVVPPPPTLPASRAAAGAKAAPRGDGTDIRSLLRFVGIALLLFGVAFLFKYSENEPPEIHLIRVAVGIALGLGLVAFGRQLLSRDRPFAQVLTGGGIGVWYMSGFAAFQLFGLVQAFPAFGYMAIVTMAAFMISVGQNSLPLTVVATLGGLATPFLLYDPQRSAVGAIAYIAVVASGAAAIHLRRKWWALVWVAAVASATAAQATISYYVQSTTPDSERWMLQGGLLFLFGLFAMTTATSYARGAHSGEATPKNDDRLFLVTLIPIAMVMLTYTLWKLSRELVGQVCLTTAFVYAGASVRTYAKTSLKRLTSAHFFVATSMAAVGALMLLEGEMQTLVIVTEALTLRLLSRRADMPMADAVSHALFFLTTILVARDLVSVAPPSVPLINGTGVTALWAIACGATAALSLRKPNLKRGYLYAAHGAILAWVLHEFAGLTNGQAMVTGMWGLYGASLLIAGLRRTIRPMRTVGLMTLMAVVVKLFMVDLATVKAIWRVLLFIGFGGVFLGLSYWFISLDRSERGRPQS